MSGPGEHPAGTENGPPSSGPQWEIVVAVVVVLIAGAVAAGAVAGTRGRPPPTPVPTTATVETPFPSATPTDPAELERRAFAQHLVGGCATDHAVWLVADGGPIVRFDGSTWSIPDPTLRSLSAAACGQTSLIAVGSAGSIVRIDDERRVVHVDRSGIEDLNAVTLLPDGALAAGTRGALLRQTSADWIPIDAGIPVDLFGVAVTGTAGWLVGEKGATYRIDGNGTRTVPSGTTVTLWAVALRSGGSAVAVGEQGTILFSSGSSWAPAAAATPGTTSPRVPSFRAVTVIGDQTWIVGDTGSVLALSGPGTRRVDLGTTCTLRAVFAQGPATWIVGSDGLHAAAWRIANGVTDHWGQCPPR